MLSRPTLAELRERIAADIESRLTGADARLRRSNLAVLSTVESGVAHGLYGYIDNVAKQIIIDTAETEYLERWASVWGLVRASSTFAVGNVAVSGTSGFSVPAGTLLQRSDGVQYATTANATLISGVGVAPVIATMPGAESNTDAGSTLVMVSAIPSVSSAAIVDSNGISGGVDVEADDGLRARLLFRIRKPPQGGADYDYQGWALDVPGVTRVWVYPLYTGPGTVAVFFVRDGDVGIIPDSTEVATVQAYIDARRPVTAIVTVLAPTPLSVNFTIHLAPDSTAIRAAVQAELADLIAREGQPGGTILISHINEAISIATGEFDHLVTVPAANVVATAGSMPVMGDITWA